MRVSLAPTNMIILSLVYASCLKRIRAQFWEHLDTVPTRVENDNEAWAVSGDFNIIANVQEKRGGPYADLGAIQYYFWGLQYYCQCPSLCYEERPY